MYDGIQYVFCVHRMKFLVIVANDGQCPLNHQWVLILFRSWTVYAFLESSQSKLDIFCEDDLLVLSVWMLARPANDNVLSLLELLCDSLCIVYNI